MSGINKLTFNLKGKPELKLHFIFNCFKYRIAEYDKGRSLLASHRTTTHVTVRRPDSSNLPEW